jgi:IS30 family transposase
MRQYQQLSYEEREMMARLRQSESSITKIALAIGRTRSTVYRELKRNQTQKGDYWPERAQQKARDRRLRGRRLDRDLALKAWVLDRLIYDLWSPEQISGFLKHRQHDIKSISFESIYSWIYDKKQWNMKLWHYLCRRKARRTRRYRYHCGGVRITGRVSIHERPQHIDKKHEFGNWEGDLMAFCRNAQHALVVRERKTMFTLSIPLASKSASVTSKSLIELLKPFPPAARKTLTVDNGGEFAEHIFVTKKLKMPVYFCDPYASWQKGGIENTNGRLRRELPRKTDIKKISKEDYQEIILNQNLTPRKNLNWLTPLEAFTQNIHLVALQT